TVVERNRCAEWNIGTGVVHVVALNALVHGAESAADDRLALARQVIGKAQTRTEGSPVVIHQTFWNSILARDANAVQIELLACQDRIGTRTQAGAGGAD